MCDVPNPIWENMQPAHVGASVSFGDTQQPSDRTGCRVVTHGLLSRSEDRTHTEDSALARWVADPANTAWMESKQPTSEWGRGGGCHIPVRTTPGGGTRLPDEPRAQYWGSELWLACVHRPRCGQLRSPGFTPHVPARRALAAAASARSPRFCRTASDSAPGALTPALPQQRSLCPVSPAPPHGAAAAH